MTFERPFWKEMGWKLWVMPCLVFCAASLPLLYAGVVARKREWVVLAFAHAGATVLGFVLVDRDRPLSYIGGMLLLAAWTGGLALALAVREEFLDRIETLNRVRRLFR